MKASDVYANESKLLKAGDLAGKEHDLTIEKAELVTFREGEKPKILLHFVGKQKGLALNKTNAAVIINAYQDDTDGWLGKKITIYPTVTDFAGETVDCIRIRPVLEKAHPDQDIPW